MDPISPLDLCKVCKCAPTECDCNFYDDSYYDEYQSDDEYDVYYDSGEETE